MDPLKHFTICYSYENCTMFYSRLLAHQHTYLAKSTTIRKIFSDLHVQKKTVVTILLLFMKNVSD